MTQVGFHLLESQSGAEAYLRLIGKCVQSLYKQGRKVYIHAKDQDQAHAVDEWLWTQELDEGTRAKCGPSGPTIHAYAYCRLKRKGNTQFDSLITKDDLQNLPTPGFKCKTGTD